MIMERPKRKQKPVVPVTESLPAKEVFVIPEAVVPTEVQGPTRWRDEILAELARLKQGAQPPAKPQAARPKPPARVTVVQKTVSETAPIQEPKPSLPEKPAVVKVEKVTPVSQAVISKPKPKLKRIRFTRSTVAALVCLCLASYLGYFLLRLDRTWPSLAQTLPWPVAISGSSVVWYTDLNFQLQTARRLKPFSNVQEQEQIAVELALEGKSLFKQLKSKNMVVTEADIAQARAKFAAAFASEQAFVKYVAQTYHWSLTEFDQHVSYPSAAAAVLASRKQADTVPLAVKAEELRSKLTLNSGSLIGLALAAGAYETGFKVIQEPMGWVQPQNMPQNLQTALSSLKPGEVTEPIQAQDGYHLYKVAASMDSTKQGQNLLVQHLVLMPVGGAWQNIQAKAITALYLLPGIAP